MDQKRLFAAIAISIGILLLFDLYNRPAREAQQSAPAAGGGRGAAGAAAGAGRPAPHADGRRARRRRAARARRSRLPVQGPRVQGTLSLRGARLDDLVLRDYRETTQPELARWCGCWRRARAARPTTRSGAGRRRTGAPPFPNNETDWQAEGGRARARLAGDPALGQRPGAGLRDRACRSTRTTWSRPSSACATPPPSRCPCCPGCGCGASARRPSRAGRCCTRASPACSTGA